MKTVYTSASLAVAAILLCWAQVITAQELEYEWRVGAGHSDNIARTPDGEVDETVGLAGLELAYEHASRGFEATIDTDVEFRTYFDDTFDDDTRGAVNADLLFKLSEDFFTWGAEGRVGHTVTDPFAAETPENRERITNLATGPDFQLRIGNATIIGLSGRYADNSFEETNADNNVLRGNLFLRRALSRNRSLSFNVNGDRVEFDDTLINSNFDRQAAFIGFSSENSKGTLVVNAGYNELHDRGTTFDGSFVQIDIDRNLTASTTFGISFDQQLTFASDLFDENQEPGLGFGDTQDIAGIANPFEVTQAAIDLNFNRQGNSLFVVVDWQEQEFVDNNLFGRSISSIRVGGGRALGRSFRVFFNASLRRTDFDEFDREDDDVSYGVGFRYQFNDTVAIELDVRRTDRDSDDPLAEFEETQGFLTLRFGR